MELSSDQLTLLDLPEQATQPKNNAAGKRKLKSVNREQTMLASIYIEELIAPDHKARAIWELVGRMDLSSFTEPLRTTEGAPGASAWDPRLLISLWVYAISEGITKAREIERWMQWEPGMMWLAALATINHHSLSDIRVKHKAALDELFVELLVVLEGAQMISLEQVAHDGMKIRALAGADSFRREKTIRQRQLQAKQVVEQLGDARGEEPLSERKQAARERAAREMEERLTAALAEVNALQEAASSEEEKPEIRVSVQRPEARNMKHGDNAIAPSYNAQITTDTKAKIIVGVDLTQCSSDAQSLIPAMEEVERNLGRTPAHGDSRWRVDAGNMQQVRREDHGADAGSLVSLKRIPTMKRIDDYIREPGIRIVNVPRGVVGQLPGGVTPTQLERAAESRSALISASSGATRIAEST